MGAISEAANVWVTEEGVPSRLIWRGKWWRVLREPVPWIKQKKTWTTLIHRLFHRTPVLIEQKLWGVQVISEDEETLVVDLAEPGSWRVTYVYD